MQQDIASDIRSRVEERFSLIDNVSEHALPFALLALENFLRNDMWCSLVLKNLLAGGDGDIDRFFLATALAPPPTPTSVHSLARFAWGSLQYIARVVALTREREPDKTQACLLHNAAMLRFNVPGISGPGDYAIFRQIHLKALQFLLLDSLDDHNALLLHLRRYCERVRYFPSHQAKLQMRAKTTAKAECELTQDAFEFLFDQGVRVWQQVVLPGRERPDFVLHLAGQEAILPMEAKVFTGNLDDVRQGYTQICRYIASARSLRPVSDACLLVYNASNARLTFATGQAGVFPVTRLNTSTPVHLAVVEVTALPSASTDKRKIVEISEEELTKGSRLKVRRVATRTSRRDRSTDPKGGR